MKKTNNKKGPSSYCLPHIKRTRIPIYLLFKIKLKGKYRSIFQNCPKTHKKISDQRGDGICRKI